jgi:hypothetical protein
LLLIMTILYKSATPMKLNSNTIAWQIKNKIHKYECPLT